MALILKISKKFVLIFWQFLFSFFNFSNIPLLLVNRIMKINKSKITKTVLLNDLERNEILKTESKDNEKKEKREGKHKNQKNRDKLIEKK